MKNINEKLEVVTKKALPFIKEDWDIWKIENTKDLFETIDWYNSLDDYMKDNFKAGLLSYLNYIDNNDFPDDCTTFAKELVIALANGFVNRGSDNNEDKAEIVYNLYKTRTAFRTSTIEYAKYAPELVTNLFAYSCFVHDFEMVKQIKQECITKYNNYKKIIELLKDEFTYNRSFVDMVSEENINEHWEIAEYVNKQFPKMVFFETNYGEVVLGIKHNIDTLNALKELKKLVDENCYWFDEEKLPDVIEFDYIYPNGANGDMIKYILEEYGETEQVEALIWKGKIRKQYLSLFEIFSREAKYISNDKNFLDIYDYHIESIIRKRFNDIYGYHINRYNSYVEIEQFLKRHKKDQKRKRTDLYSQLIMQGKASPKWKSEAQLYALITSVYPDAVYQYQPEWLGAQSLDIYIPSLSLGIEYQGIQHYKPIDYFGGEKHFKHQQENDALKKRLCRENNVNLIEWPYTEEISMENMKLILGEQK